MFSSSLLKKLMLTFIGPEELGELEKVEFALPSIPDNRYLWFRESKELQKLSSEELVPLSQLILSNLVLEIS